MGSNRSCLKKNYIMLKVSMSAITIRNLTLSRTESSESYTYVNVKLRAVCGSFNPSSLSQNRPKTSLLNVSSHDTTLMLG